ncbi:MAG: COX15/CtaA family protein [Chitinophagales bacterium]|nr:COX15/CtaA family protein [Chitinophagales bacterium]MDW8427334.1 COX15/CtaA family protein [Chitinophagales bacterium]
MTPSSSLLLGRWLLLGVVMVVVQIWLGGVTRLTGSGLSIPQWDLIMGTIPPLNTQQWEEAFEKYKMFPQYRLLNADMELNGFKRIYWWEYIHRLWGRLLAIAFLVPLLWFLWKQLIPRRLLLQLVGLFALGALQGLLGWIMVASGLVDRPWVDPLKLALHLLLALLLLSLLFLLAMLYLKPGAQAEHPTLQRFGIALLILLSIQFFFGGLMAGYKAGLLYPTFPRIGTHWIPPGIWSLKPWWLNFLENTVAIHTFHRLLGYLIAFVALIGCARMYSTARNRTQRLALLMLSALVVAQVLLGILTVVHALGQIPLLWASAHQMVGVLLWLCVIWLVCLSRRPALSTHA